MATTENGNVLTVTAGQTNLYPTTEYKTLFTETANISATMTSMMTSTVYPTEFSTGNITAEFNANATDLGGPVGDTRISIGPFYFGQIPELRVPIYGYVTPILTFLTVITNVMVCIVLLRKQMRSPTNILLGAIALANMLTCLSSMPVLLYLFGTGSHMDYITVEWCYVFKITAIAMPSMFHTVSIWLTVALAIQRHIVIKLPFKAKLIVTNQNILITIAIIFILGIFSHSSRIYDSEYVPTELPSLVNANMTTVACNELMMPWVGDPNSYFSVYYWSRAIFIHFIPCTMLVVLNTLLINEMRKAQKRRNAMTNQAMNKNSEHNKASSRMTKLLVAVVSLFLVVELPAGIFFIVFVIPQTFGVVVLDITLQYKIILILDSLILLSYPANIIIYSTMSKKFRVGFMDVFCCCKFQCVIVKQESKYIVENSTYTSEL